MNAPAVKMTKYLVSKKSDILAILGLVFLGYAFYNPALRLVPVDFDDLVLLSHVKNTTNPFNFFIQDWGFGNYGYRPLHSLSLWIGFQVFGVSSGPNQLINIILHILLIVLLYIFISRFQPNHFLAFSFSALAMVSLYTFSPPTWVSDRPTLFAGFFLLINLIYLSSEKKKSFLILLALSIFALMSKESGVIVPLISIIFLFFREGFSKKNWGAFAGLGGLVLVYLVFRLIIFGSSAGTYDEAGYIFGYRYYENPTELSGFYRFLAPMENVIKNIIAVFLPVFDGQGKVSLIGTLANTVVLTLSAVLLTVLAWKKKMGLYQKVGIVLIILNALVHFQVFRYRTLYLAQVGWVIFLAASPVFQSISGKALAALAASAILVLWNIHIIGEDLTYMILDRMQTIQLPDFRESILASSNRIDPEVVSMIIEKYRH